MYNIVLNIHQIIVIYLQNYKIWIEYKHKYSYSSHLKMASTVAYMSKNNWITNNLPIQKSELIYTEKDINYILCSFVRVF